MVPKKKATTVVLVNGHAVKLPSKYSLLPIDPCLEELPSVVGNNQSTQRLITGHGDGSSAISRTCVSAPHKAKGVPQKGGQKESKSQRVHRSQHEQATVLRTQ